MWLLKKQKEKIERIKGGSHGSHWNISRIFKTKEESIAMIKKTVEDGKIAHNSKYLGKELAVIQYNFKDLITTLITLGGRVETAFPVIKDASIFNAEIKKGYEWSNGVEAQINASIGNSLKASIDFFATDYAINKEKYKTLNNATVCLSAIAYAIRIGGLEGREVKDAKGKTHPFDPKFTGFFPMQTSIDDYQFYGEVKAVKMIKFEENNAYLFNTKIAGTNEEEITIPIAALKINIVGEIPKKGDIINGAFWLEGELKTN